MFLSFRGMCLLKKVRKVGPGRTAITGGMIIEVEVEEGVESRCPICIKSATLLITICDIAESVLGLICNIGYKCCASLEEGVTLKGNGCRYGSAGSEHCCLECAYF